MALEMVSGDVATVSQAERDHRPDASVEAPSPPKSPDLEVSYWDKQEEIHKNAHFHGASMSNLTGLYSLRPLTGWRILLRGTHPSELAHYCGSNDRDPAANQQPIAPP